MSTSSTMTGDYTMPYGKHEGKLISDIPSKYLKWFLDNIDIENRLYIEIDREYQFREKTNTHWDD